MFNSIKKEQVKQSSDKNEDKNDFEFKELPSLVMEWKTTPCATIKSILIPLNKRVCNNGRFNNLDDAMQFICNHCVKYYGSFKRNTARKYIDLIEVLDPLEGGYIIGASIQSKEFNKSFTRSSIGRFGFLSPIQIP